MYAASTTGHVHAFRRTRFRGDAMASTLTGSLVAVGLLWTALTVNRRGAASAPINRPRSAVSQQASTLPAEQSATVGGQSSCVDGLASNKVSGGPRRRAAPVGRAAGPRRAYVGGGRRIGRNRYGRHRRVLVYSRFLSATRDSQLR